MLNDKMAFEGRSVLKMAQKGTLNWFIIQSLIPAHGDINVDIERFQAEIRQQTSQSKAAGGDPQLVSRPHRAAITGRESRGRPSGFIFSTYRV